MPSSTALAPLAPTLSVNDAVDVLRQALELAAGFEARELSWRPHPTDLALDEAGRLVLVEKRGVFPLEHPARFDVGPVLIALGACLVPAPLAHASPALVRILLPRKDASVPHTVDGARRAVESVDLREPDAAGACAALSDIGLWRDRNDDVALVTSGGTRAPWHVLVVCDGVSSVPHAGRAASAAALAAHDAIVRAADTDADARTILTNAVRVADAAVRRLAAEVRSAIGTTIVAALVRGDELTVGWVGDSRAYVVTDRGEEVVTVDHARERELTKCLGMVDTEGDDAFVEADVAQRSIDPAATIVLCTDGLWNYFPSSSNVARLVRNVQSTSKNPTVLARFLVGSALASGGADNVSVAVLKREPVVG
ncbi:MAG: PP2C family protein-serine/threonine phosphatase [Polyangiaceae bacterium]